MDDWFTHFIEEIIFVVVVSIYMIYGVETYYKNHEEVPAPIGSTIKMELKQ